MSLQKKTSFNPDDFLTRAERIAKVQLPESDRSVVIVKPNSEGIGFRFNCYSKEFLAPQIDKALFDKTVMQCHKICEGTYLQKKNEEEAEFNATSKKILVGGILLVLTALILLIIRVYGSSNDNLLVAALVLISVTIISTVLVVIKMYLTSPQFINLPQVTKERLLQFLANENRVAYNHKGFEWKMEPNYYWLELHRLKDVPADVLTGTLKQARENTERDALFETLQTES